MMNKQEFLSDLAEKIDCLPQEDIERWLDYYAEMIDDRVEDGMSEEQAVYALGNIYDIATQIMMDTPIRTLVKTRTRPTHKLAAWEYVLIILGAVVWVPLLLALVITVVSLYGALWAVIIALYVTAAALGVAGIAMIAAGVMKAVTGSVAELIPFIGGGIFMTGFAMVFTVVVNAAARFTLKVSKALWRRIKKLLIRKEHTV